MRPLELEITGLRSYRQKVTVNFEDLDLVAIVGPTGAGKSSLLEAVTYALYGNPTWEERSAKALISDHAVRMTVRLRFRTDEEIWEIQRSTPRGTAPPASQRLECLSHPEHGRFDSATAVRDKVHELIGLDFDGFRSCVLLPQGRFDELLRARPAARTDILKGILGLQGLDEIRERARVLVAQLEPRLIEIADRRGLFLADPAADLAAATAQLAELAPRGENLQHLAERTADKLAEADALTGQAKLHQQAAAQIRALIDEDRDQRLRELAALAEQLAAALANAEQRRDAAQCASDQAHEQVRQLAAGGLDETSLTALDGTLRAAHGTASELGAEQARRPEIERARDTAQRTHADAKQAAADADAAAFEAEQGLRAARADREAERERRDALQKRIEGLAAARRAAADTVAARARAETALDTAARAVKDADATANTAERALEEAVCALREAQRANAAVHAAHGLHAGDACPVCARALPEGFQPPVGSGVLDGLAEAATAAQSAASDARSDLASARTRAKLALETLADSETAERDARDVYAQFRREPLPDGLDPDTVTLTEQATALLSAKLEAADERVKVRDGALTQRRQQQSDAAAARVGAEGKLAAAEDRLTELHDRIKKLTSVRGEQLAALPAFIAVANDAGSDALWAAIDAIPALLERARCVAAAAQSAGSELLDAERAVNAANNRISTELTSKVADERAHVELLANALSARGLGAPEVPGGGGERVAALRDTASQLDQAARELIAGAGEQEQAARERAEQARRDADQALRKAGFNDGDALRDELDKNRAELLIAGAEAAVAETQIEPVARLDGLRERAQAMRDQARELARLLGDGSFPKFCVERRQRALLELSSDILLHMTADMYGFAEGFQIVDRRSGSARGPETLSGGEKFMASLALALGLVELARSSGGKLDALFIDEGFGSLDQSTLDRVLGELQARARHGRLIATISHVPTVAEQIEDVLSVQHGPQGSTVTSLSGEEREALLRTDFANLTAGDAV